jgi:hypothetical protein
VIDAALAALGAELRRLARRRAALAVTLLLPVVAMALVGLALGDDHLGHVHVAWADAVTFTEVPEAGAVRAAVDAGDVGAGLVVPADAATGGVEVVEGDDALAAGVVGTIADEVAVRVRAATLAAAHGVDGTQLEPALSLSVTSPGGRLLDPAVYWGPALAAFFVLLGLGYAAQRQVADRRSGVRARAVASGAGSGPVLAGQALAGVLVGVSGMAIMAVTSGLLFDGSWGPAPSVALAMVATAVAVTGIAALVAGASRTPGQAQTLTAVVAFTLAIAGGSFTTPGSGLRPTGLLALLPTRVSLDAFSRIITTGAGPGALAGPLAILLLTGTAGMTAGIALDRRSV